MAVSVMTATMARIVSIVWVSDISGCVMMIRYGFICSIISIFSSIFQFPAFTEDDIAELIHAQMRSSLSLGCFPQGYLRSFTNVFVVEKDRF